MGASPRNFHEPFLQFHQRKKGREKNDFVENLITKYDDDEREEFSGAAFACDGPEGEEIHRIRAALFRRRCHFLSLSRSRSRTVPLRRMDIVSVTLPSHWARFI